MEKLPVTELSEHVKFGKPVVGWSFITMILTVHNILLIAIRGSGRMARKIPCNLLLSSSNTERHEKWWPTWLTNMFHYMWTEQQAEIILFKIRLDFESTFFCWVVWVFLEQSSHLFPWRKGWCAPQSGCGEKRLEDTCYTPISWGPAISIAVAIFPPLRCITINT